MIHWNFLSKCPYRNVILARFLTTTEGVRACRLPGTSILEDPRHHQADASQATHSVVSRWQLTEDRPAPESVRRARRTTEPKEPLYYSAESRAWLRPDSTEEAWNGKTTSWQPCEHICQGEFFHLKTSWDSGSSVVDRFIFIHSAGPDMSWTSAREIL